MRYGKRKRRGIFHGHFLEFGTKTAGARPFLKPALDARGAQAVSILAASILVIDTETTGINPDTDAIVELAAVELTAGVVGRSFTIRIKCDTNP